LARSRVTSSFLRLASSAPRARALGLAAHPDVDAVVHAFIEDDFEVQKALV
jgi:hypothetical protein